MQHILILGAGLSASSLIKYLLDHSEEFNWQIRLGDLSVETAEDGQQALEKVLYKALLKLRTLSPMQ